MGLSHSLRARAAGLKLKSKKRRQQNKSSVTEIMCLGGKLLQQGVKDKDEQYGSRPSHEGVGDVGNCIPRPAA